MCCVLRYFSTLTKVGTVLQEPTNDAKVPAFQKVANDYDKEVRRVEGSLTRVQGQLEPWWRVQELQP